LLACGVALFAMPALAQTAPATQNAPATSASTSNTPATDAVGPRELQNFSLPGTVTRPPEQQQQPATAVPSPVAAAQSGGRTAAVPRRTVENVKAPNQVPARTANAPPRAV